MLENLFGRELHEMSPCDGTQAPILTETFIVHFWFYNKNLFTDNNAMRTERRISDRTENCSSKLYLFQGYTKWLVFPLNLWQPAKINFYCLSHKNSKKFQKISLVQLGDILLKCSEIWTKNEENLEKVQENFEIFWLKFLWKFDFFTIF